MRIPFQALEPAQQKEACMPRVVDGLPDVPPTASAWNEAARLLEQAVKAGNQDPEAAYLLAMCYKHVGRIADARQVLARIGQPDANVLLQRGILALIDRDFAQAAPMLAQSRANDPASYPAAYNLLLARLCQGEYAACTQLIPQIMPLAVAPGDQRLLALLRALLLGMPGTAIPANVALEEQALMAAVTDEEETTLVSMVAGLGSFEVVFPLLKELISTRPRSAIAYGAYFGAALLQGKQLMERFHWEDAYALLAALARSVGEGEAPRPEPSAADDAMSIVALHNMLGTCSCMLQDHEHGAWYFSNAQEAFYRARGTAGPPSSKKRGNSRRTDTALSGRDLFKPLRSSKTWHWPMNGKTSSTKPRTTGTAISIFSTNAPPRRPKPNRRQPPPPLTKGQPSRVPLFPTEGGLSRVPLPFTKGGPGGVPPTFPSSPSKPRAGSPTFTSKRKNGRPPSVSFSAQRWRPADNDVLERLFQLYTQLKKTDEAKRVLRRLRELRPNDPQVELFEMDVRDFRLPDDIDKTLGDVRRILQSNPGDMRIEERAGAIIHNMVPALERLGEQYTNQINKVIEQMRRLPSYQINWPLVRNVMRELEDKFFQLRRMSQKCLALVTSEDLRRDINGLVTHCDRKIDQCHSLGE